MKGVPVRRLTIPRIPAPPEIVRAERARPVRPSANANDNDAAASFRRGGKELTRWPHETQRRARHVPGPEDLYPMLRAENAEVVIHPSDWKYGALLVGGQGTGKTSALLTFSRESR